MNGKIGGGCLFVICHGLTNFCGLQKQVHTQEMYDAYFQMDVVCKSKAPIQCIYFWNPMDIKPETKIYAVCWLHSLIIPFTEKIMISWIWADCKLVFPPDIIELVILH